MPNQQVSISSKLRAIPGITIKPSDNEIKIEKISSTNSVIQTPPDLSVAFRWQKKDQAGQITSGAIPPLSQDRPTEKITGVVEIQRLKNGSHQVTTEAGTICTVLLKKKDGEKVEVPVNTTLAKANENKPQTRAEPKSDDKLGPTKPALTNKFDTMVLPSKTREPFVSPNKIESLEAQAKKLNLPDSVLNKARELRLTDLSKIESRVEGNNRYYEICENNACIPLGQVPIQQPLSVQPPIITGPDLENIPAGTSVRFTVGGVTNNIRITNPAAVAITDDRIGRLSKNKDGSLKLTVSPQYQGTVTIGNESKIFTGGNLDSNTPQLHRGEPLRNIAKIVANGISAKLNIRGVTEMSGSDAKLFVQQNPDKNVVVIVTALQGCKYCDIYKPQISNIAANVPNSTFIVVPTASPGPQNQTNFNETMYPSNFVYRAGRTNDLGTTVAGTSNAQQLNGALGR